MESLEAKRLALSKDPRDSRQWRALRKTILARDGYVCCYCGQDADTVDHVLPIKNHPDLAMSPDNLVSACRRCNSAKGSRSEGSFLGNKFTPPVFRDFLSPTQSKIHEDSPFTAKPVGN
jgi:5-methylcytosine-specific restriction endonuclease McrA